MRKFKLKLKKVPGYCWGILTLFIIFLSFWISLFFLEGEKNPRCSDPFDAFRVMLALFLGEYEEFGPVTTLGKIISILSLILGVAIVATLIARLASVFIEKKREVKMPKEIEDHIVICNWNEKGERIVREIHSPQASPEIPIVIITDKEDKETREQELRMAYSEYENVFFVKGDPTLHNILKNGANAHLAKSIIILADERCPDPDAKTALIALAITKLEKNRPKKSHIVAEVINHRKIEHLRDAGVDEWVCSTDYGLGIIAQCALYQKLSDVYQQLLTYSKETNEIYLVEGSKFPRAILGKSFKEAVNFLNENRDYNNPVLLIGVKRNKKIIINPKEGEFDIFKEGDALIVMAYDPPDLS